MQGPQSVQISPENFQSEVIERSQEVPVMVLFWAEQMAPSVQAKALAEQVIGGYAGKVVLALSDVGQDPMIAQQLRVQGLPSIRVIHEGKIADQIEGPFDEAQLRAMIDPLTQSVADLIKSQLQEGIATQGLATAAQMLQEVINEEPNNQILRVELADVLIRSDDLSNAETVLAGIPDTIEEKSRPQERLAFAQEAAGLASMTDLETRLSADPQNLELRYQLAVQQVVAGEFEPALEACLAILRADREFRDDLARLTMIRVFKVLGKGDPLASQYRRRLFNAMH